MKSHTFCPRHSGATLGASGVANKLFIAFLFSDPDFGVQFLKDVGLIEAVWRAVNAGHKFPGASILTCGRLPMVMSEGYSCFLMLCIRVN
jgi:hypothetical protein